MKEEKNCTCRLEDDIDETAPFLPFRSRVLPQEKRIKEEKSVVLELSWRSSEDFSGQDVLSLWQFCCV